MPLNHPFLMFSLPFADLPHLFIRNGLPHLFAFFNHAMIWIPNAPRGKTDALILHIFRIGKLGRLASVTGRQ